MAKKKKVVAPGEAETPEESELLGPTVEAATSDLNIPVPAALADPISEEEAYSQANLTAAQDNVAPYNGIEDWRRRTGGLKGAK